MEENVASLLDTYKSLTPAQRDGFMKSAIDFEGLPRFGRLLRTFGLHLETEMSRDNRNETEVDPEAESRE